MEVMNCKNCKRLFNYIGGQMICPSCKDKLEQKFLEVKQYIRENPSKNISEISKEVDVSIHQLKTWVRQERLSFTSESNMTIDCEKCGSPIRTGRFCESCKRNMVNTLDALYKKEDVSKPKRHGSDKMRHL